MVEKQKVQNNPFEHNIDSKIVLFKGRELLGFRIGLNKFSRLW